MKILIADDEANIRNFLKTVLTNYGHTVIFAGCGNTALQIIVSEKPDLVFLDYQMPNTNGIEVVQELAKNKNRIIVVLMSGHDMSEFESEFDKHKNICGFLPKPFEINDLQMCMADIQQQHEQAHH